MRTVKTASGATAVQVVWSSARGSRSMDHIGSAHTPEDIAILLEAHKAAEATLTSQGDLDFIRPILALQYKERFAHIMEN